MIRASPDGPQVDDIQSQLQQNRIRCTSMHGGWWDGDGGWCIPWLPRSRGKKYMEKSCGWLMIDDWWLMIDERRRRKKTRTQQRLQQQKAHPQQSCLFKKTEWGSPIIAVVNFKVLVDLQFLTLADGPLLQKSINHLFDRSCNWFLKPQQKKDGKKCIHLGELLYHFFSNSKIISEGYFSVMFHDSQNEPTDFEDDSTVLNYLFRFLNRVISKVAIVMKDIIKSFHDSVFGIPP